MDLWLIVVMWAHQMRLQKAMRIIFWKREKVEGVECKNAQLSQVDGFFILLFFCHSLWSDIIFSLQNISLTTPLLLSFFLCHSHSPPPPPISLSLSLSLSVSLSLSLFVGLSLSLSLSLSLPPSFQWLLSSFEAFPSSPRPHSIVPFIHATVDPLNKSQR